MASWKQTTWYIFHMFTLNFKEEKKEYYQTFFSSFKVLLPCDICINHYREQLNTPGLRLRENISKDKLFGWTIKIHNNVNASNKKRVWNIQESKDYYQKEVFDKNQLKVMILEYVKYNFKKGPVKTEELFKMLKSLCHIYPDPEKSEKLLSIPFPINRDNIRSWLIQFFQILYDS